MAITLKYKDGDEDYFGCYARVLGPIDRYAKVSDRWLRTRWHDLRREYGAALMILHREPGSTIGKEMLALVEPHHEAAIQEIRGRLGITPAKIEKCKEALRKMDAEERA